MALKNKIAAITQEIESLVRQNDYLKLIVDTYQTMFNAEERKFFLGESSVFFENSRESKLMDAILKTVRLENDF